MEDFFEIMEKIEKMKFSTKLCFYSLALIHSITLAVIGILSLIVILKK